MMWGALHLDDVNGFILAHGGKLINPGDTSTQLFAGIVKAYAKVMGFTFNPEDTEIEAARRRKTPEASNEPPLNILAPAGMDSQEANQLAQSMRSRRRTNIGPLSSEQMFAMWDRGEFL